MKNSIILGIALITFGNVIGANKNSFSTQTVKDALKMEDSVFGKFNPTTEETIIMNPETVFAYKYAKTPEETIAADNQIIESNVANNEIRPLINLEPTVEDRIAEDNRIIESVILETQPLDFGIINQKKTVFPKAGARL